MPSKFETLRTELDLDTNFDIFLEQVVNGEKNEAWLGFYQSVLALPLDEHIARNRHQGYYREKVLPDGDCAFAAIGITRNEAYLLLIKNIQKIRNIIQLPLSAALLTDPFIEYLNKNLGITASSTEEYANSEEVQRAYITYDVLNKEIDAGFAHPAILQALAEIQGFQLYLWKLNSGDFLTPHATYEANYSIYTSTSFMPTFSEIKHLAYVNNNHFDKITLYGYGDKIPKDSIYPIEINALKTLLSIGILYLLESLNEDEFKEAINEKFPTMAPDMIQSLWQAINGEESLSEILLSEIPLNEIFASGLRCIANQYEQYGYDKQKLDAFISEQNLYIHNVDTSDPDRIINYVNTTVKEGLKKLLRVPDIEVERFNRIFDDQVTSTLVEVIFGASCNNPQDMAGAIKHLFFKPIQTLPDWITKLIDTIETGIRFVIESHDINLNLRAFINEQTDCLLAEFEKYQDPNSKNYIEHDPELRFNKFCNTILAFFKDTTKSALKLNLPQMDNDVFNSLFCAHVQNKLIEKLSEAREMLYPPKSTQLR